MKDSRPTFLSLFAGIGGIDLGLERAGWRCVGQVEIDPFARRVLAKHWPDVPRFEDVRTFTSESVAEPITLICGGFPCEDISNAGRRAGIDGQHSGLWSEFVRIIRVVRPRFVLVENVAALLVRGIDRVLGDLAALGFDAEWSVISACALGAPHMRERLFIVSYPASEREFQRRWSERPPLCTAEGNVHLWRGEPLPAGVAHGIPNRMDRIRTNGKAVVPQVAEFIGRRILQADGVAA